MCITNCYRWSVEDNMSLQIGTLSKFICRRYETCQLKPICTQIAGAHFFLMRADLFEHL